MFPVPGPGVGRELFERPPVLHHLEVVESPSTKRNPRSPESGRVDSSLSIRGIAEKTRCQLPGRRRRLIGIPMRKTSKSSSTRGLFR